MIAEWCGAANMLAQLARKPLHNPLRSELVEGYAQLNQGLRQAHYERMGIVQMFPRDIENCFC